MTTLYDSQVRVMLTHYVIQLWEALILTEALCFTLSLGTQRSGGILPHKVTWGYIAT